MYVGVPTDPPPPPPGSLAADRPTRRPPRFGSTKGGGPPPPTAPKTVAHPSGSHIGWRRPRCMCVSHCIDKQKLLCKWQPASGPWGHATAHVWTAQPLVMILCCAQEWILKNQELQDQMDQMLNATEAKHVTNRALMEQNKILTVEYKAQADDQKFLSKELDVAKRRNTSLKDRIHELEAQMTEVQKPVSEGKKSGSREKADIETGFLSSLKDAKSANLSETEKQSKFEEALERVKKLSEIERRNLDQVRAAHLHTLSMRTELEVLLRESITEVQVCKHCINDASLN